MSCSMLTEDYGDIFIQMQNIKLKQEIIKIIKENEKQEEE